MTRWIENVSLSDAHLGRHFDPGPNSLLIRIQDPATEFKPTKFNFASVHEFEFLDAEDADGFPDECKISDGQAKSLVILLQQAMLNHMNVVVHCNAGVCRSGAVVEVASMMGFTPTDRLRIPNLRVKHKMMKVLGLTYDADEKQEAVNGKVTTGGIIVPLNDEEWS
jgi:rhodanese-related sulfurtransferase